jgi:hypothetical protein
MLLDLIAFYRTGCLNGTTKKKELLGKVVLPASG